MGRLLAWLKLSRLPFLTVGLAPFISSVLLGVSEGFSLDLNLLFISISGLTLMMLFTYYTNEYFDYECDLLNSEFNRFSGGSRILSSSILPRKFALYSAFSSIGVFSILSYLYMIYYFSRFPLILPFALVGSFIGIFYTAPPLKFSYRGLGELLIGFCYGWLAFNSGYYLLSGRLGLIPTLLSIPASLSVFLVILINEFPDLKADSLAGKSNLVVRLGPDKASMLYIVGTVGAYMFIPIAVIFGAPMSLMLTTLPLLALSAILSFKAIRKEYKERERLEQICALTLIFNLLCSLVLIPSFFIGW